jgi:hypothetical protein
VLNKNDMISVVIDDAELDECMCNPVQGFARASTGQLKALGNLAVRKALEIPVQEFEEQLEAATDMGAAYVCEARNGLVVGIAPTVSTIRVQDVITQRVIVPYDQLYRHPYIHEHYTVGVFLNCDKDSTGTITHISQATVAGWIQTDNLRRWVTKNGRPPFTIRNTRMAIAPCDVLNPMRSLVSTVKWKKFCV